ncbi:SGNH/GDSL hydrolase family protein [Acetobacter malorum]|uniref:SGNH/GDSL hydrolase family protein n=1 Tax=Acetobacter malorum TaxID=178901 RepID=UPI0039E8FA8B
MDNKMKNLEIFINKCKIFYNKNIKEFYINEDCHIEGNNSPYVMDIIRRVILKGSGNISGCNERTLYPSHLPFPQMYRPNIDPRHLKFFHKKKSFKNNIKWFFVGDSILSVGSDIVAPSESPSYTWSDEILKQNPGININFYNFAIGGTTWSDLAGPTPPSPWWGVNEKLSWLQNIIASEPDVICFWFGGNDGRQINIPAMHSVIAMINEKLPETDIILAVTYLPSFGSTLWTGYGTVAGQQDRMFAQNYLRSYARWKDIGYLDVGRWHMMMRDGYDPCEISLTRVIPTTDTNLQEFNLPLSWDTDKWFFPDCKNDNKVSANACTDWSISFNVKIPPSSLMFNLSGPDDAINQPTGNNLFIFFNKSTISIKISNGGAQHDPINIDLNISPEQLELNWFNITLKDSRITISMPRAGFFPDVNANRIGAGYIDIFDMQVPRFGGRYHPFIAGLAHVEELTVYNLCIADSTRADGGCRRYMPTHADYELYAFSESAGGSNDYHMNTYGVRDVIAPVIRNECWS